MLSDSSRIYFFFHSGERIQKYPDLLLNLPDACGQKLYPERKSCGFKNVQIRVDRALVSNLVGWLKFTTSQINIQPNCHTHAFSSYNLCAGLHL